ncbi:zonadhesin isoform X2 [Drosophila santomea]|uniref:zonadhesin isoform X2 n=1 Tax=Drosophila santomea TaxID=129105 RepID=UPI001953BCDC|nr:zonadhesin isoform X2 [Drosophila santomea]
MRILLIAAISVSWQFSDAYLFMPNFLCIPPFVAINGSCLIPTTTKPLIPPCLKNSQNVTVFPKNRKIVTVSPWNILPEDDDNIGKNISKDKEASLPIKVPVKPITENSPSAGAVEGGNKDQRLNPTVPDANKLPTDSLVNPSNPEPNDTFFKKPEVSDQNKRNPEIISPSKQSGKGSNSGSALKEYDQNKINPGQKTDESKNSGKGSNTGSKLKPIPGSRPGTTPMNPTISQTENLGNGILPSKKPTKIPLPPILGESVGFLPSSPSIPDSVKIDNGILPSEIPIQHPLPGDLGLPKDPSMPETVPVKDLTIPDADKLTDGILPSIDLPRDLLTPEVPSNPKEISKIEPTKPIIPDTDEIINRLLPSERLNQIQLPGIPESKPPMLPKIPKPDHLINGKLPSRDLIGKQHPSKNPKDPNTDEVNRLLPSERPNQITLPGITGVGSETQPKVPPLPVTDNLVDLLKPPRIPSHKIPGSKPPMLPTIPNTEQLINGKLPSGDLIGKQHPSKNPKIPDDYEVINGLLPNERPNQIPLPEITGVGSGTQPIEPTLPVTDNLEDLLKPPGIPPLEMPGSNQQIHPKIPKTDHLINGELPSADLIAKPDPPKINLPGMPKITDPKIPKMIRPEDLYPKDINIYQLLPKDIFY